MNINSLSASILEELQVNKKDISLQSCRQKLIWCARETARNFKGNIIAGTEFLSKYSTRVIY